MTQLSKVKQNIHWHTDISCNQKNHKKSTSRPNRAVWTVFVNCAHWWGSTLAIYKTVLIIFPLNLQTITITLDVVKWRWGGSQYLTKFTFQHQWNSHLAIAHMAVTVCCRVQLGQIKWWKNCHKFTKSEHLRVFMLMYWYMEKGFYEPNPQLTFNFTKNTHNTNTGSYQKQI